MVDSAMLALGRLDGVSALLPDKALFLHGSVRKEAVLAMELLAELGIARELTGRRRNRLYVYDRYLAVLNEGMEAP